jgi:hypothetical protein
MNALLKKDALFKWDNNSMRSFEDIKEAITMAPSLVSLNYSRDFIIFSFSFEDTIVRVLLQKNEDDYEQPVVVLIHTCKHELSSAHLVCPWRHNARFTTHAVTLTGTSSI